MTDGWSRRYLLFVDEVFYCGTYQNIVGFSLLALFPIRIVEVQSQCFVEVGKFALYSFHKSFVTCFPCAFHQFVPSLDVDGRAICFQIHGVDGLSCWQLVGLPNPNLRPFPFVGSVRSNIGKRFYKAAQNGLVETTKPRNLVGIARNTQMTICGRLMCHSATSSEAVLGGVSQGRHFAT